MVRLKADATYVVLRFSHVRVRLQPDLTFMATFARAIPVLRIFDEVKAREFYVDFLGFTIDWEHRFEPGTPLYMQVSKDQCVLHLSEHYGDGVPGAAIRIDTNDIDAFHRELIAKQYKYARPGIQDQSWGMREVSVKDPFGNKLTFASPLRT